MASGSPVLGNSQVPQLQQILQQLQSGQGQSWATPSNYASTNQNFSQPFQQPSAAPQYQPQGQTQSGQDQTQIGQTNPSAGPDGGGAPTQGYGDQTAAMQTPLGAGSQPLQIPMQGNKPLNMSQFRPQQGLQVQGNPTSQVVGQGQQNG